MSNQQLEVQIMGQSYLLGCPADGEPRLRGAVRRVDTTMTRIRDSGKVRARDRIAVLAALNLAFELVDRDGMAHQPGVLDASSLPENASDASDASDFAPTSEPAAENWQDWLQLLQRLDAAIEEDGRLL